MVINGVTIKKYPQSGFSISNGQMTIFIDPFNIDDELRIADVILLSHEHFDHCDPDSIKSVAKPEALIYGNEFVQNKLVNNGLLDMYKFTIIRPGESFEIANLIKIETVPAYNIDKFRIPGETYHPKQNGGMGFVIQMDNFKAYFMGDTDFNAEDHLVTGLDLLMIPVSGTYVMESDEAAAAANQIKAKVNVPMHFDAGIVGSKMDAEDFARNVIGKVEIMEVEQKTNP